MKENIIKEAYISAFDIEDKALKDLIIINTKCLVDDIIQRYVYIDNNRLKDELIYHRCYGETLQYDNILNIIMPLSLSNTNLQKSEQEVISLIEKYVKYLKKEDKKFKYILGAIIYNSILHSIIENQNIEYKDLLQKSKEKIIEFSIELDKLSTVKFQMERIKVIQVIDNYIELDLEKNKEENIITELLDTIYQIYIEDGEGYNYGMQSIKKTISSILGEKTNYSTDNIEFIKTMAEYISKLRQYKINKKIYNQKSDPRYLINLNEGDTKLDPILNQISIVSKNFNDNILNVKVKSKSGTYILKFKKS